MAWNKSWTFYLTGEWGDKTQHSTKTKENSTKSKELTLPFQYFCRRLYISCPQRCTTLKTRATLNSELLTGKTFQRAPMTDQIQWGFTPAEKDQHWLLRCILRHFFFMLKCSQLLFPHKELLDTPESDLGLTKQRDVTTFSGEQTDPIASSVGLPSH